METLKRRAALAAAIALVASGCTTPPPPPPPVEKKPELSAETSARIDEALDLLNNPNVEEKWLKQLVTCGQEDELAKRAVIDRTVAAVKRSYNVAPGPGILKPQGRRRAVEALDKVGGDDPAALEVFKLGAKESNAEVSGAAAAALLSRGDDGALAALLASVRLARNDATTQERAVAPLIKLAKPGRLESYLAALDPGCRKALAPAVLACIKDDRNGTLRQVARSHKNPQARLLALEELVAARDDEVPALARESSASEDVELRARCLELLAAQGGKPAAKDLATALGKDPKDADAVAKLLGTVDSPEVVLSACVLVLDRSRAPATRAAVCRHVLGRLKDPAAPASLREAAARERGLGALRKTTNDGEDEVARAAIEALGASGDESEADGLVLLFNQRPQDGESIVRALGKLGGSTAADTIVERHGKDAKLRPACREALVAFRTFDAFQPDQVMLLIRQLLSPDLDVRKSALAVLKALKGDSDVHDFDPQGEPSARERSVDRWLQWWKKRLAQRGG